MTERFGHFLSEDHLDLFQLLITRQVGGILFGGVAVAYHGYVRTTEDNDLLNRPEEANVRRLFQARDEFFDGIYPDPGSYEFFLEEGKIFGFGRAPERVEFLNKIDGVTFTAPDSAVSRGRTRG